MDQTNTLHDTIAEDQSTSNSPGLDIELDWEEYYRRFCEAHGKYPVIVNDLLVFPDGWRYSSTDYAGPEYPPPTDSAHLNVLLLAYWQRRYEIVRYEYRRIESLISSLRNLQLGKSVPLQHRMTFKDDDGKVQTKAEPVRLELMEQRHKWLRDDLINCTDKLRSLGYNIMVKL